VHGTMEFRRPKPWPVMFQAPRMMATMTHTQAAAPFSARRAKSNRSMHYAVPVSCSCQCYKNWWHSNLYLHGRAHCGFILWLSVHPPNRVLLMVTIVTWSWLQLQPYVSTVYVTQFHILYVMDLRSGATHMKD